MSTNDSSRAHKEGAPVAIITGANGGIGGATVEKFLANGYRVYGIDLNLSTQDRGPRFTSLALDSTDREAVLAAMAKIAADEGRIDCLVTCAIRSVHAPLENGNEAAFDVMIESGLKGCYWAIQGVVPAMKAAGKGAIVTMSSIAKDVSIANTSMYSSVKGAISALTLQLAVELAPAGIRVNAAAPGPVRTPLTESLHTPERFELRIKRSPMGFLQDTSAMADVIYFLGTDQSRAVTGQTLVADGGLSIYAI